MGSGAGAHVRGPRRVIAIDTNILVYAHRQDAPWHEKASVSVRELAEGRAPWAIPWPCIHEFLAVVTHSRIYDPPTGLTEALDQISAWMESPSLVLLSEGSGYIQHLRDLLDSSKMTGARVHDARVAALCGYHGVAELWSADRDFTRFPALKTRNPLID
jgi:toxin-antitoxin system PIN domain toxin